MCIDWVRSGQSCLTDQVYQVRYLPVQPSYSVNKAIVPYSLTVLRGGLLATHSHCIQFICVTPTYDIWLFVRLCCLLAFAFTFHQTWFRFQTIFSLFPFRSTFHTAKEWSPSTRTQSCWSGLIFCFKWKTSFCINQSFTRRCVWRRQLFFDFVDILLVHKIKETMSYQIRLFREKKKPNSYNNFNFTIAPPLLIVWITKFFF